MLKTSRWFKKLPDTNPKSITGQKGEQAAEHYLQIQGYRTLARNWLCKVGEIDLIMQDGQTRVFVEVRTRHSTTFGAGLDTVGPDKQRKIINTARFYQQIENYWGDIRFDVVSIEIRKDNDPAIEHISHAFTL
jgi:putative endonuclease